MTKDEAEKAVAIALAACPAHAARLDAQASRNMVTAWAILLEDLSGSEVASALKRHFASNKWLPSIAEIREICAEAKHGSRRPGGEAWEDVRKAIHAFGAYRTPAFADPVTARAVKALGWRELCLSENQAADRARFVELYDQLAISEHKEKVIGELPGAARPANRQLPQAEQVSALVKKVANRGQ